MKKKNIIKTLLTAWLLLLVLCVAGTPAEAKKKKKAKAYKAKTVKITKGKTKTVKTSKKIKKVKISSKNKNFKVKKTASKKFKLSGTDVGKTQAVKVTYTNGNTQKYTVKTVKASSSSASKSGTYKKKVVAELKALMADPDKGLDTVCAYWCKKEPPRNSRYETICKVHVTMNWGYESGVGSDNMKLYTMDEAKKIFSASQKKALILQAYCEARMTYDGTAKYKGNYWYAYQEEHFGSKKAPDDSFFKNVYNGVFRGVCSDGSAMATDLGNAAGLKAIQVLDSSENHAWCCIKVTDKSGNSYWQGVRATSDAYNMKSSTPGDKYINRDKYIYHPITTRIYTVDRKKSSAAAATPTPVPTQAPVITAAPTQTPAPTPKPTLSPEEIDDLFNKFMPTQEPVATQAPAAEPSATPTAEPTASPTSAPTAAPTVTPAPTAAPTVTPTPTATPAVTPEPTQTPEQRIVIPYAEHNYTCPGCTPPNAKMCRHTDKSRAYMTNNSASYKDITVYKHMTGATVRYFDANWNEYIDVNNNGSIADELITLFG